MIKVSKDIGIALLAAAAVACHVAPAKAETHLNGYTCHVGYVQISSGTRIETVSYESVLNYKQCFELCNKTPSCVAVDFGKWTQMKSYACILYSSVPKLVKHDPKQGSWMACLKPPTHRYPGPPQTYQEIPHIPPPYRQEQERPGPQPGPGGRR